MQWDKSERNTSEKSSYQTSPNWRENLPRLEGALFHGLGAWRINFFYFQNHFLKIHAQQIPKMPNFKVLSHFRLRKWLSKIKKRVLTPSFPQPTSSSKWVGETKGVKRAFLSLTVIFSARNGSKLKSRTFFGICFA